MSQKQEFHNLDNSDDGLFRELAPGLTMRCRHHRATLPLDIV